MLCVTVLREAGKVGRSLKASVSASSYVGEYVGGGGEGGDDGCWYTT